MAGFSDYLENLVLSKTLRNVDFTITTIYVSLHTADPGDTGANEVSGGSYGRLSSTFGAPVAGVSASNQANTFTGMPATTVTHVGLWDAATAGNFLYGGPLGATKTVNAGDNITLASGAITVTVD